MRLLKIVVGTLLAIWASVLVLLLWQDWAHADSTAIAVAVGVVSLFALYLVRFLPECLSEPRTNVAEAKADSQIPTVRPMSRWVQVLSAIRVSLGGAFLLLAWDVVISGSFQYSLIVCPLWFLVSVVKNPIQRPGWTIALVRIAIPALTLGIVLINNSVQWNNAEVNAERIIKACDEFHVANGKYPHSLDELVPRYLESVPRAKYCLVWGEFWYWKFDDNPSMVWWKVPPFGKKIYNFEKRRWSYLD